MGAGVVEGGTVGPARVTWAVAAAGGAWHRLHFSTPFTEGSRCTVRSGRV